MNAAATCPLCGTTIRSATSAMLDGRRGHTACVNAEKARGPVPAWRADR